MSKYNHFESSVVNPSYQNNNIIKFLLAWAIAVLLLYANTVLAASAPEGSLGSTAETITGSFSALAKLITAGAYVAGFGFVLGAIFKFKAHKDNPTQIPIGTPIALLFIGAAMVFLPQIITVSGKTVFADDATPGSVTGTDEVPGYQ